MKKVKFLAIALFLIAGLSFQANSQNKNKVGHISIQELLKNMPEYNEMIKKAQAKEDSLTAEISMMEAELQKQYDEYLAIEKTLTETMKSMKMESLKFSQTQIERRKASVQEEYSDFIDNLQKPLYDKIKNAIKEVAIENGYSHVFDSSQGLLLYNDDAFDIYDLVAKKLGVTAPRTTTPAKTGSTSPATKTTPLKK